MTSTTRQTTITTTRLPTVGAARPAALALLAVLFAAAAGGCGGGKLATGYQYRPLGASDTQRRAYYAPEYSREAAMAQQERPAATDPRPRRPNPGSY